jgi:hypothetical protein
LVIAAVNVAAVELTIRWNKITGVNTISSVGQTIPLVIGIGAVVRIAYVYRFKEREIEKEPRLPTDPKDIIEVRIMPPT